MNDPSTVLTDYTKKYHIPLSHIEHKYIQHCTDGVELEQIYQELIGGQEGSHPLLENLTLERIRNVQPDSQIFRREKTQFDRSTVNNDGFSSASIVEDQQNNDWIFSIPLLTNEYDRTVPKNNDEWKKLEEKVFREFNSDCEDNQSGDFVLENKSYEANKRLHTAEQYRLNGETAFRLENYQQAIDSYTNSLLLDKNLYDYMVRAAAYFELDNFEASIRDCSEILSVDPNNLKALFYRAKCYLAKQQYDEAKRDLDNILIIDPDIPETQDLLNTLLAIQKTNNTEDTDIQPPIITYLNMNEGQMDNSMGVDTPRREPIIHSNPGSSSTFDHHNRNHFQLSSPNGDDDADDMALGDEAGVGLVENLSDEEGHIARSINVSPTMEEFSDVQELVSQKPLHTPRKNVNITDESIGFEIDKNNKPNSYSTISHNQTNDDYHDLYGHNNNYSSYKPYTVKTNETYMQSPTINDAILNSNFGSIIQSWLRDLIQLQSNPRLYDRPWSKSTRPWSLDRIQRDIDRFNRFDEYTNAIEVSKKMLQNGILDYHHHAEYIADALIICAQCYLKLNDYLHAIQYASEALQYNKIDENTLMCRAKAFENEKLFLFSYADNARVPVNNFDYRLAQRTCEKLAIELNSIEGETWREKLPIDQDDDERFLIYLKMKTNHSEKNSYQWYETHANQFYLDACFILAIRCYTYCIDLQPQIIDIYLKRAACYLKVFESQKAIDDCNVILKEDKNNLLALYYKASAYKISRDYRLHELTLKEYIKIQPNNQIILAEYYTCRHEQIPRKKRRIRTILTNENALSYEELEQIRLAERFPNASLDSNDIKDQCSFILHLSEKNSLQSFNLATTKLIEIIINTSRVMIQAEQNYQEENQSKILPFSYNKFCFHILNELATLPEIEIYLLTIHENDRILLNDLISYYSAIYNDVEKLNRLK